MFHWLEQKAVSPELARLIITKYIQIISPAAMLAALVTGALCKRLMSKNVLYVFRTIERGGGVINELQHSCSSTVSRSLRSAVLPDSP